VRAARRRLIRSHHSCCLRCQGGSRSTTRHGAPPRARSEGSGGKGHEGRGVVCQDSWRAGAGETMDATEMVFLMHSACEYAQVWDKKKQRKIRAMQWHGQVMPPCHCIAKIATEELGSCRLLRDWSQMGGGNEQNGQESAPPEVSLAQNRFLVFRLSFRKRRKPQEGLRKRKKEADSKTAILILGKSKSKGEPYLTRNFFYGCHPYYRSS
jgi:hypothetical protein